MRLVNAISVGISDHELTHDERQSAGTALHYAYGIGMGGLYGAAAELAPVVTIGAGLGYGASIWVVADEGVVPARSVSQSQRLNIRFPFMLTRSRLTLFTG